MSSRTLSVLSCPALVRGLLGANELASGTPEDDDTRVTSLRALMSPIFLATAVVFSLTLPATGRSELTDSSYQYFTSCAHLDSELTTAYGQSGYYGFPAISQLIKLSTGAAVVPTTQMQITSTTLATATGFATSAAVATTSGTQAIAADSPEFSGTTVQVEGVDEADLVKTDGEYIYTVVNKYVDNQTIRELIIAKAYPLEHARVLSQTDLRDVTPIEMFMDANRLVVIGRRSEPVPVPYPYEPATPPSAIPGNAFVAIPDASRSGVIYPSPYQSSYTVVQIWNVSNKEDPIEIERLEFEGTYLSSRKIGDRVYFVLNSYPQYYIIEQGSSAEDVIPKFRVKRQGNVLRPQAECTEIAYFAPIQFERFLTIASISLPTTDAFSSTDVTTRVIVGSGKDLYASLNNLYVAEGGYGASVGIAPDFYGTHTIVHKFAFSPEDSMYGVTYMGNMHVPGRVLDQFSMDEYQTYFRIATTLGFASRTGTSSATNVYVYDGENNQVGALEGVAPGEDMHSARFIGERAYLVTFKKIDPFFVLGLGDPRNPVVLGELKIPGYSDYLHPYDDDHILGFGKDTVEAEVRGGNFAWYQGVKIALFDVSDVSAPREEDKVVIGHRGTSTPVLDTHKALLFKPPVYSAMGALQEPALLALPVLLAEIEGPLDRLPSSTYGEYVYQGAYVFDIDENDIDGDGKVFELRAGGPADPGVQITHYDSKEPWSRQPERDVQRILYIDNVLYTISQAKIEFNALDWQLEHLGELVF